MNKTKELNLQDNALVTPTPEDIAAFERLSGAERRAFVQREIQKGMDSGVSEMTMADIWAEAVRQVEAKTRKANAV